MEKCECLHHGRCLAWPGQNWAEEELYPPPPRRLLPVPGKPAVNQFSCWAWARPYC